MINNLIKKLNNAETLTSQEEKYLANAIGSNGDNFNLSKEVFNCYYDIGKTPQTSMLLKAIYTEEVLFSLTPNKLIFVYENLTAIKEYNSPIYFFMTEIALLQEVALSTKDKLNDKLINILLDTILALHDKLKEECKDLLWDNINRQWFIDIIKDGATDAVREKLFDLMINVEDIEIFKILRTNSITIGDMIISSFYIFFPDNTFFNVNKLKDNTGNFTYDGSRLINDIVINILETINSEKEKYIFDKLIKNLSLSSPLLVLKTLDSINTRLRNSNLLNAIKYLFEVDQKTVIEEIVKKDKVNYELLDYIIYDNGNYSYKNYILEICSKNIKSVQMFNYILKNLHPFDELFDILCTWVLTTDIVDEDKRNNYIQRINLVHIIKTKNFI